MEAMELGQRVVKCKHWRWMPGMRDRGGNVYLGQRFRAPDGLHQWARLDGGAWEWSEADFGLPDFTDAATLGCLLALVRAACEPNRAPGDWPLVCTYQSQAKKWGVGAWLNESGKATFAALVLPAFDTEAEALVDALEAAP